MMPSWSRIRKNKLKMNLTVTLTFFLLINAIENTSKHVYDVTL